MTKPFTAEHELDGFSDFVLIAESPRATIFKAENTTLARTVAIKILKLEGASQHEIQNAFKKDVKKLASLRQENIVSVHKFGVLSSGCPFIAMDYINGKSVRDFASSRTVPNLVICSIFSQVFAALAEAKKHSMVMRGCDDILVSYEKQTQNTTASLSKNTLRYLALLINLK